MPPIHRLPSLIRPGLINFPATATSKNVIEKLLQDDRDKHHCFFSSVGFHNHLSHHLLAAYDLGAPAKLLQAIYDEEKKMQRPVDLGNKETTIEDVNLLDITKDNWQTFLGQETNYASLLAFFSAEVAAHGPEKTLEDYVFAPSANANEANMLLRFVAGLFHSFIQTGYGAEFGSNAIIAQGIAQAAVSSAYAPALFKSSPSDVSNTSAQDQSPGGPLPLLEILRQVYDSPILKPVMPYDPNAFIRTRLQDALKDGRPEEIRRLAALWWPSQPELQSKDLENKVEELFWTTTLLLAGTGKPGRKPRLDFFLLHVLNATLFLPSILKLISDQSKEKLLKTLLPVVLVVLELRGRPRIQPELLMSYTATPQPPSLGKIDEPKAAVGDPRDPESVNPWAAVVASVIHAPDSHTIKAVRALFYAAQKYGSTAAGDVVGAFRDEEGKVETHKGMGKVDGTLFVRAAGVVMDTLGWVTHGQPAGEWDRSALGWEDAWKNED